MAVQDYYFALQNLSRSNKIFGFYSGSANFNYRFDYLTSSASPGAGDIRLNSGSLLPGSTTNEVSATEIYLDEDDINNILFNEKLNDNEIINKLKSYKYEVQNKKSINFTDFNIINLIPILSDKSYKSVRNITDFLNNIKLFKKILNKN